MTKANKAAFVARMAKARRKKNPSTVKANGATKRSAKRRRNPQPAAPTRRRRTMRRRNPEVLAMLRDPRGLATNVLAALIAAVATKQIPQLLLKEGNAGWKGYLANAATGLAVTLGANEFVSPGAAAASLLGSGVIVLDRVLTEKFSPVGRYLSLTGLGDATAATQLGEVANGFYIHPTIVDANGKPIIPHEFTDAALSAFDARQQPAPAAGQLGGIGNARNRFQSRFN